MMYPEKSAAKAPADASRHRAIPGFIGRLLAAILSQPEKP
jgi:hypothetical protein